MNDRFLEQCERMLPPGSVDASVDPPAIMPADIQSAADIVRLVSEEKLSIDIDGGGTYPRLAHGAGMVRLSTRGMKGGSVIDTDDFVAEVSAGTTVDEAIAAAAESGMEFPLDLFSGAEATVGGAFMTRACGGPRRIGATFPDSVLGGKFIVASGDVVSAGGRMIKNVTGYDLTRFFAGSMGLFGLATRLYVKLTALREASKVLMIRIPSGADAVAALDELMTAAAPDVAQLAAPGGLGEEVLVRLRFSGFAAIVDAASQRAGNIAARHHATVESMDDSTSREMIRTAVTPVFEADTVSGMIQAAAVGTALKRIRESGPGMPLALQVKDGRFWFNLSGGDAFDGISKALTSIGGKRPVAWKDIRNSGIAGLYTDAELAIIRSLKHELDPAGLFNPELTP